MTDQPPILLERHGRTALLTLNRPDFGNAVNGELREALNDAWRTVAEDNEIRVEYMGASARYAIHVKYVIAAALAGIGGGLAATTVGHIDPDMSYWTTSGEFIFMAILAGTGSVVAPFAGALIFGVIHTTAYDLSPNTWQMFLGVSLLLLIFFLPEGLWSLFKRRKAA